MSTIRTLISLALSRTLCLRRAMKYLALALSVCDVCAYSHTSLNGAYVELSLTRVVQSIHAAQTPMWESAKTVAPTPNSVIIQLNVDENFVINSTHLKMILENKFNGYLRADSHDHIREFLTICNMFKYGETQSEAVKLLIFPFSLCDEAKT
ncbi:hypothetical protein Tco_0545395 [Tanacetum coccineum]